MAAFDVVVKSAARTQRHEDHVALGALGGLANRLRHFTGLAVTEADAALLVAYDDESGEAEPASALHDLGDAIDVNELVDDAVVAVFTVTVAVTTAPFPLILCHILVPCSFPEARLLRCRRLASEVAGGENHGASASVRRESQPLKSKAPDRIVRKSGRLRGQHRQAP